MTSYRILVADDDMDLQEARYKQLLDEPSDFDWQPVGERQEFEATNFDDFDAVLLDINLTKWAEMPLTEAVQRIGNRTPIVLVSGKWEGDEGRVTATRIQEVLAQSKDAHFVQILILNDLIEGNWKPRAEAMRAQLRIAIARHHRRGILQLKDSDSINLLHLSDPQYGDPNTDGWASMAEHEIADYLDQIQPDIHFVAITGDISYQGLPSEYETALSRLEPLLEELLSYRPDWRERVLLVPGNHDVNLRLAAVNGITYDFATRAPTLVDGEANLSGKADFALHPFRDFAWKLTGDPRWREADDLCWVNDAFRHLGVRFYLLNSAGQINCTEPDRASIPIDTVRRLARDKTHSTKLFSIAFSHHGPPDGNDMEVSISNWPDIAKLMQTKGIRLFIHGHGHKRDVFRQAWEKQVPNTKTGQIGTDEFVRAMAPTTHLNGQLRPDGAPRGFNLITLHRNRGKVFKVDVDSHELGNGQPRPLETKEFRFR